VGRRISVKGTSGSGKTTFAEPLAQRLGVAHVELDALHHGPDWSEPSAEEFRRRLAAAMRTNSDGLGVIDGNYDSKLDDLVLCEADTIVLARSALPRQAPPPLAADAPPDPQPGRTAERQPGDLARRLREPRIDLSLADPRARTPPPRVASSFPAATRVSSGFRSVDDTRRRLER
jgi:hypothetical protein